MSPHPAAWLTAVLEAGMSEAAANVANALTVQALQGQTLSGECLTDAQAELISAGYLAHTPAELTGAKNWSRAVVELTLPHEAAPSDAGGDVAPDMHWPNERWQARLNNELHLRCPGMQGIDWIMWRAAILYLNEKYPGFTANKKGVPHLDNIEPELAHDGWLEKVGDEWQLRIPEGKG